MSNNQIQKDRLPKKPHQRNAAVRKKTSGRLGRGLLASFLAISMALSLCLPALAAEKPADMDEDTWVRLQDNVLEYSELENRVASFNPTMVQIVDTINENYETVDESVADYHEAANDFERLYDEAIDEGDYQSAVMYQINRAITRQLSASYIKQGNKRDTTIDRSTRQYRKMFTSACQQLMVAYNQMAVNKATLEKQVELYGQMAALSVTQGNIGMATSTDILSAQANMYSAQSSLTALEDQMASIKSSLLLLTGWDYDSDVTIGTIPAADVNQIDSIDLAADKAIAPSNNYTIISMRNSSPADADGDGHYENKDYKARERGVDQAKQQLSITLDSLYQTLFEKRAALQAQETAFTAATLKWEGAQKKYQMGMLGAAEYIGEELSYCAAQAAYQTADLNMTQAMLNYYWAVNGLGQLTE